MYPIIQWDRYLVFRCSFPGQQVIDSNAEVAIEVVEQPIQSCVVNSLITSRIQSCQNTQRYPTLGSQTAQAQGGLPLTGSFDIDLGEQYS
jgi:hypothetical protein